MVICTDFLVVLTDGNSARRDFLNYALSLMRAHNDEHSDNLPVIDISAMKHVAYVFDALIYYMRSGTDTDTDVIRDGVSVHSWQDHDENENEEQDDDPVNQNITMETESIDGESDLGTKAGRKHPFFQRSDSTTFLGCPPADPFQVALIEALPLADQPHLLQPNSRREDLFGVPRQPITPPQDIPSSSTGEDPVVMVTPPIQQHPSPFEKLPTHLALSVRGITESTSHAHAAFPVGPTATGSTDSTQAPGAAASSVVPGGHVVTSASVAPSTVPANPDSASVNTSTPGGTSVIVRPSSVPSTEQSSAGVPTDAPPAPDNTGLSSSSTVSNVLTTTTTADATATINTASMATTSSSVTTDQSAEERSIIKQVRLNKATIFCC